MSGEFWHVADDGTHTDVTEAVQVMYDALHSSMDFGSGFLDAEEVAQMRRVGTVAGWDPMVYSLDVCQCGHVRDNHSDYGHRGKGACHHGWDIDGYIGRDATGRAVVTERYAYQVTRHEGLTVEAVVRTEGCQCEAFTLSDMPTA